PGLPAERVVTGRDEDHERPRFSLGVFRRDEELVALPARVEVPGELGGLGAEAGGDEVPGEAGGRIDDDLVEEPGGRVGGEGGLSCEQGYHGGEGDEETT